MRAVKTVIAIWLLCALALWIRGDQGFSVLEALPFVQRSGSLSRDYEWFALGSPADRFVGLSDADSQAGPATATKWHSIPYWPPPSPGDDHRPGLAHSTGDTCPELCRGRRGF